MASFDGTPSGSPFLLFQLLHHPKLSNHALFYVNAGYHGSAWSIFRRTPLYQYPIYSPIIKDDGVSRPTAIG